VVIGKTPFSDEKGFFMPSFAWNPVRETFSDFFYQSEALRLVFQRLIC